MKHITIQSQKKKEIIDITKRIEDEIKGTGVVNIFLTHTTCAITTADLDPGTDLDMLDAFEDMVPPHQSEARYGASKIKYRHPHDPYHVPDHILSSIIGTSLSLPYENGKLILGTWQRVVLIELYGPRERNIVLSLK